MTSEQRGSAESEEDLNDVDREVGLDSVVLSWLQRFSPKMSKRLADARASAGLEQYREEVERVVTGYKRYRPIEASRPEATDCYLIVNSKLLGEAVALALPHDIDKAPDPIFDGMVTFTVGEVLKMAGMLPEEAARVCQVKRLLPGSTVREHKEHVPHEAMGEDDRRDVPGESTGRALSILQQTPSELAPSFEGPWLEGVEEE